MLWIGFVCCLLGASEEPPPDQALTTGRRSERGDVTRSELPGSRPPAPEPRLVDPDLEPGFPVQAWHTAGSYHGGPAIHTLVGNMDADPQLETVATALAVGPLYAWNHDGSLVPGWPVASLAGAAYPVLGQFDKATSALEVFSAHGDGVDEVFLEEEDVQLHAYRADGSVLPGWPVYQAVGGQERHTPALADLDGDGDLEIVTATDTFLLAYHHSGMPVTDFPAVGSAYVDAFPAIGDVDGDGAPEIVVVTREAGAPFRSVARILSANGSTERTRTASASVPYGSAPALADLDGDGVPEIVVQTDSTLEVWKGDGTVVSGWPQVWTGRWLGGSAPVVGDVTGDGEPDIVVVTQIGGSSVDGEVRLYDRHGNLDGRFPKLLRIGSGAVPAIADIDLDGRNEIVVTGSFWNGYSGYYDKLWVYDLGGPPHGPVQWGQFMGGPGTRVPTAAKAISSSEAASS